MPVRQAGAVQAFARCRRQQPDACGRRRACQFAEQRQRAAIRRAAWASADARMLARMEHDPALTREQITHLYRTYRDQLSGDGIALSAAPPPIAGTGHRAHWGPGRPLSSSGHPRRTRLIEIAGWAWSLTAAPLYSWRVDRA